MELLTFVLLVIITVLLFFLLKKERVLGINTENKIEDNKLDEDDSKKYRETIYNLLNYIPEGIIILNKSKEIIFSNSSASKRFQTKLNKKYFTMKPDETIFIPLGAIHRIENPYKKPVKIIEAQVGSILKETDIVRYQDVYGRVK